MPSPSTPPISIYLRSHLTILIMTGVVGLVTALLILAVAEATAPGTLPFLHLLPVTWAAWAAAIYNPRQRFFNMHVQGPKGEIVYMFGGKVERSKD